MDSRKTAHVIEGCLEPEPENRWQSARDVKAELEWAAERAIQSMAGATGAVAIERAVYRQALASLNRIPFQNGIDGAQQRGLPDLGNSPRAASSKIAARKVRRFSSVRDLRIVSRHLRSSADNHWRMLSTDWHALLKHFCYKMSGYLENDELGMLKIARFGCKATTCGRISSKRNRPTSPGRVR